MGVLLPLKREASAVDAMGAGGPFRIRGFSRFAPHSRIAEFPAMAPAEYLIPTVGRAFGASVAFYPSHCPASDASSGSELDIPCESLFSNIIRTGLKFDENYVAAREDGSKSAPRGASLSPGSVFASIDVAEMQKRNMKDRVKPPSRKAISLNGGIISRPPSRSKRTHLRHIAT